MSTTAAIALFRNGRTGAATLLSRASRTRTLSSSSSSDCDQKEILFSLDTETQIGTLTLNAPKRYNALSPSMGRQFKAQIEYLSEKLSDHTDNESDLSKMKALILTGSGTKAFSAGGDYSWLHSIASNPVHVNADIMYNFYKSFLSIRDLPIPTIASVHGPAIGAGACLALACDFRVMGKSRGKIGFPFAKLGLHSGMGGSHFMPLIMGESQSMEAMLLGKVFDANEAKRVGLTNRVVEVDEMGDDDDDGKEAECVKKDAFELGKELACKDPLAMRSMVRTMRMREDKVGDGLEASLRREAYAQSLCYARREWGEGMDAVMERRAPEFGEYFDP